MENAWIIGMGLGPGIARRARGFGVNYYHNRTLFTHQLAGKRHIGMT